MRSPGPVPAPSGRKEKDPSIETLRGLAIVCVVVGHVIGDESYYGLRVGPGSIYRYWYDATRYLRMPMFFAISGYLYAHRPAVAGKFAEFARGKVRLLVLPFLSVATLQYLVKGILPGVNMSTHIQDIWRIYAFGFDQFWFSQATILTFATVLILERFSPIANLHKWLIYLLLAVVYEFAGPKVAAFSFSNYSQMLPIFFLGCILYRPPTWSRGTAALAAVALVFLAVLTLQQLIWFGRMPARCWDSLHLGIFESSSFIYLMFRLRWTSPGLAYFGGFAYPIYLFHVFGTAGTRVLMVRLGIHDRPILFAIGVAGGLAVPIVIDHVLRRTVILRRIFLGGR